MYSLSKLRKGLTQKKTSERMRKIVIINIGGWKTEFARPAEVKEGRWNRLSSPMAVKLFVLLMLQKYNSW